MTPNDLMTSNDSEKAKYAFYAGPPGDGCCTTTSTPDRREDSFRVRAFLCLLVCPFILLLSYPLIRDETYHLFVVSSPHFSGAVCTIVNDEPPARPIPTHPGYGVILRVPPPHLVGGIAQQCHWIHVPPRRDLLPPIGRRLAQLPCGGAVRERHVRSVGHTPRRRDPARGGRRRSLPPVAAL